jgi:hypothetical protein
MRTIQALQEAYSKRDAQLILRTGEGETTVGIALTDFDIEFLEPQILTLPGEFWSRSTESTKFVLRGVIQESHGIHIKENHVS